MKICFSCRITKPLSDFGKNKAKHDGHNIYCKVCVRNNANQYRKTPVGKLSHYNGNFKNRYKTLNVSIQIKQKLLTNQQNKCAICGLEELNKSLSLDHNHKTGEIRALLCFRCNTTIGKVEENIELLEKMITYLTYYNKKA